MLAARWPDDIRGKKKYDHPKWHYINYPFKPAGQPDSVKPAEPGEENIVHMPAKKVSAVPTTMMISASQSMMVTA